MQDEILAEARDWLGTPYRHQASVKHVGCDCLGLIRGVWRHVMGNEPEQPPAYTPNWAEDGGDETLLLAARRHLAECAIGDVQPGDVLLFRMATGHPAKHCAIVSGEGCILHAYWGRSVCETRLTPWWERRIAAAFQFPASSG